MTKYNERVVNLLKAQIDNKEHLIEMFKDNPAKWEKVPTLKAECHALQSVIYLLTDKKFLEEKEVIYFD